MAFSYAAAMAGTSRNSGESFEKGTARSPRRAPFAKEFLRRSVPIRCGQSANPDVAEAHRVPVILQFDRAFDDRGLVVVGEVTMAGRAEVGRVVLHEYAVAKRRDDRGLRHLAVRVEARRGEDDIIRLPFPRRPRGIYQRRHLAIERASGAVGVGAVVVAVEHLELVKAEQEHAGVAATLAVATGRIRRRELDVKLAIAELLLRENVACLRHAFDVTVLDAESAQWRQ